MARAPKFVSRPAMADLAPEYNNLAILGVPRCCTSSDSRGFRSHANHCSHAFPPLPRRTPVTTETYEIVAIKYGEFTSRRRYESFIGADDHDAPHPIDYYVWLIRNANRTILVDCGFDEAEASKRGRRIARTPAGALEMLGVGAAKVDQLIV